MNRHLLPVVAAAHQLATRWAKKCFIPTTDPFDSPSAVHQAKATQGHLRRHSSLESGVGPRATSAPALEQADQLRVTVSLIAPEAEGSQTRSKIPQLCSWYGGCVGLLRKSMRVVRSICHEEVKMRHVQTTSAPVDANTQHLPRDGF